MPSASRIILGMEPMAFLNGRWIPASAAAVPVSDAGFVLGATVAEQLRTFAGKLFRLDDHLARLAHSLEIVGVKPGMTPEQLARTAEELVARNHALLAAGRRSWRCRSSSRPATIRRFGETTGGSGAAHRLPAHLPAAVPSLGREVSRRPGVGHHRRGTGLAAMLAAGLKCRSRMHYYLADRQAGGRRSASPGLAAGRPGLRDRGVDGQSADLPCRRRVDFAADRQKSCRGISLSVVGGTGPAARHPLRLSAI